MWKKIFWLVFFILLNTSVSGQMILKPMKTGYIQDYTCYQHHYDSCQGQNYGLPTMRNCWRSTYTQGWKFLTTTNCVVEFNIQQTVDGNEFPPSEMTAYNWTAQLIDLIVIDGFPAGDECYVTLYDLPDEYEDGEINLMDYCGLNGDHIKVLFYEIPPAGTVIAPIDLTNSLRRDLFGEGTGDVTSGLYLYCWGISPGIRSQIAYDHDSLRIKVNMFGSHPTLTPLPATPTPTATPDDYVVHISTSQTKYQKGDMFLLTTEFFNPLDAIIVEEYIIFDIYGSYFFYPSWTESMDSTFLLLPELMTTYTILEFIWPDVCGQAEGLIFWIGLVETGTANILGTINSVSFGYY
ncbi:hypothetical protein K8T06_11665 [bacterium]|nr:hypothetical protein [bacterium]